MTFDDWWGAYPTQEDYEANCRDAWEAGAASRDAEIAELKHEIETIARIAESVRTERDQLREQVTLLRGILLKIDLTIDGSLSPQHYAWKRAVEEVLAATEEKK